MTTRAWAVAAALSLATTAHADDSLRSEIDAINQEIARLEVLLAQPNLTDVGRAQERVSTLRERVSKASTWAARVETRLADTQKALETAEGRAQKAEARVKELEGGLPAGAKADAKAPDGKPAAAVVIPARAVEDRKPMPSDDYDALQRSVAGAGSDAARTTFLKAALPTRYVTCAQAAGLLKTYSRTLEKFTAIQVMAPRLIDRENAPLLQSAFSRAADKQRAVELAAP